MYIHQCRFDFMAKYLYIKHREKNTKTNFFKELYHKHLITFNGCKELPDTSCGETSISKSCIEDFYNSNWGHDYPFINEWTDKERKNYFINFYNDNAQFLIATQIFIGLQSFFKVNNIDYIFFDAIDSTSREVHRDYTKHHTKQIHR